MSYLPLQQVMGPEDTNMAINPFKDVGHLTKFDGTNFTRWQQGLFLILEQHDLLKIVNGTETKPTEVNTDTLFV